MTEPYVEPIPEAAQIRDCREHDYDYEEEGISGPIDMSGLPLMNARKWVQYLAENYNRNGRSDFSRDGVLKELDAILLCYATVVGCGDGKFSAKEREWLAVRDNTLQVIVFYK